VLVDELDKVDWLVLDDSVTLDTDDADVVELVLYELVLLLRELPDALDVDDDDSSGELLED
jgi:hypothetical protein